MIKIQVRASVYNGDQQEIEMVEISEMDILELAEKRIRDDYPYRAQPKKVYPAIVKIEGVS